MLYVYITEQKNAFKEISSLGGNIKKTFYKSGAIAQLYYTMANRTEGNLCKTDKQMSQTGKSVH